MKLEKQTAVVTGASSGLGQAIAVEFAREGANVVIDYVGERDSANNTLNAIAAIGGISLAVKADVSNETDVQNLFKQAVEAFGTVDILMNNSGLQADAAFHDMTLEQWNKVIGINLTGQFLCAREAVKEFQRRGMVPERSKALGKIICMSSVHEVIPWTGHANYAASKGGVNMLMKTLAQELGPQKIRVNSIGPGAIRTHINEKAWGTPEALKSLLTLIPAGRIGEPEDVGKAAVWLASDDSDYVTGTTLFVDGGMLLYNAFASNG